MSAEVGALAPPIEEAPDTAVQQLTERERAVLTRLAAGVATAAIARELGTSENAIKQQAYRLRQKLGAASTAEAVAIARERGLLGAEGRRDQ